MKCKLVILRKKYELWDEMYSRNSEKKLGIARWNVNLEFWGKIRNCEMKCKLGILRKKYEIRDESKLRILRKNLELQNEM